MGEIPPQPTGHEPLVRRWNAAKGYAEWVEVQPTHCAEGHPYLIGRPDAQVSISWVGCGCDNARGGGHSLYICYQRVNGADCRDVRWLPECVNPERQASGHYQG